MKTENKLMETLHRLTTHFHWNGVLRTLPSTEFLQ